MVSFYFETDANDVYSVAYSRIVSTHSQPVSWVRSAAELTVTVSIDDAAAAEHQNWF